MALWTLQVFHMNIIYLFRHLTNIENREKETLFMFSLIQPTNQPPTHLPHKRSFDIQNGLNIYQFEFTKLNFTLLQTLS